MLKRTSQSAPPPIAAGSPASTSSGQLRRNSTSRSPSITGPLAGLPSNPNPIESSSLNNNAQSSEDSFFENAAVNLGLHLDSSSETASFVSANPDSRSKTASFVSANSASRSKTASFVSANSDSRSETTSFVSANENSAQHNATDAETASLTDDETRSELHYENTSLPVSGQSEPRRRRLIVEETESEGSESSSYEIEESERSRSSWQPNEMIDRWLDTLPSIPLEYTNPNASQNRRSEGATTASQTLEKERNSIIYEIGKNIQENPEIFKKNSHVLSLEKLQTYNIDTLKSILSQVKSPSQAIGPRPTANHHQQQAQSYATHHQHPPAHGYAPPYQFYPPYTHHYIQPQPYIQHIHYPVAQQGSFLENLMNFFNPYAGIHSALQTQHAMQMNHYLNYQYPAHSWQQPYAQNFTHQPYVTYQPTGNFHAGRAY
ncbi:hypothetical protein [Mycoavidus cysteinexigens]|uniref:hypothetical protein n=1 Tax=Mycoavidus cysteinexigens TaxID=1553431 RepID=UPI000F834745|nr:hypothetical protein [Mycoavidus cysteinexigens]GAM51936.1 hypothetical protein EBME_0399 [bacterium endosymbiont of Mortierella elongata FMR23-6]